MTTLHPADLLRQEVLALSGGECVFDGDWKVVHYDKTVFGFEDEEEEIWTAWAGEPPEVVDSEAFCGRHSLYVSWFKSTSICTGSPILMVSPLPLQVPDSRTLAFNLDPADYDGYGINHVCLMSRLH